MIQKRYSPFEMLVANICDANFETYVDANQMRLALESSFYKQNIEFTVKELKESGFVVAPKANEHYYRTNENAKFEIIKSLFDEVLK